MLFVIISNDHNSSYTIAVQPQGYDKTFVRVHAVLVLKDPFTVELNGKNPGSSILLIAPVALKFK